MTTQAPENSGTQAFIASACQARGYSEPDTPSPYFGMAPFSLAIYQDEVYVANSNRPGDNPQPVEVFTLAGQHLRTFGWLPYLFYIAIDDDEVFLTNLSWTVYVVTGNGEALRQWSINAPGIPSDIAIYNDEIYMPTYINPPLSMRVIVRGKYGGVKRAWPLMSHPFHFAVYNDEVYVCTFSGIHVYTLTGTLLRTWTTGAIPFAIAVHNNEVYVTPWSLTGSVNQFVRVYTPSGVFKRGWGIVGFGDGEMWSARDIAVYNDEVYVLDVHLYRIQVFDLLGNYRRQWS